MTDENGTLPEGYQLIRSNWVRECGSEIVVVKHAETGLEVMALLNDDEQKVFCAAFKTPVWDDTGVSHIIEHSVLNGSKKYPLKEPFAELLKASLNTFLNAFTYPDRTLYPVASCNSQDFYNLTDVYLDAVFNPFLDKNTFLQEGWHYTFKENKLGLSGVVYNEMLGATSSPESKLYREIEKNLFKGSNYVAESGGDPEAIPELSYEAFCEFHKKYYHPSNCKIVLYGDVNLADELEHIDQFIKGFGCGVPIDKPVKPPVFTEPSLVHSTYAADQVKENTTFLSKTWLLDPRHDPVEAFGLYLLYKILLGNSGAPLRKALMDAEICEDTMEWYEQELMLPVFNISLRGSNQEAKTDFEEIIQKTLTDLYKVGIPDAKIQAALQPIEFRLREAVYSGYPKGLAYALNIFSAWNYDLKPETYLAYESILDAVKMKLSDGNFLESLIKKYLLDNQHQVMIVLEPDADFEVKRLAKLDDWLIKKQASFNEAQLDNIIKEQEVLQEEQQRMDKPEDLARIPVLPLTAVLPTIQQYPFELNSEHTAFSAIETQGISYVKYVWDLQALSTEELLFVPLICEGLTHMGTKAYDFVELHQKIGLFTGGFSVREKVIHDVDLAVDPKAKIFISTKCLESKLNDTLELIHEVATTTNWTLIERLKSLILMQRAQQEASVQQSISSIVSVRLDAMINNRNSIQEYFTGYTQLAFLRELEKKVLLNPEKVASTFQKITQKIFQKHNLLVHTTASPKMQNNINRSICSKLTDISNLELTKQEWGLKVLNSGEALLCPSKVQYVGLGVDLDVEGVSPSGSWIALNQLLSRDFLWNQVRVIGGAYGCRLNIDPIKKQMAAVSYRDPQLAQTYDAYKAIPEFLKNLDYSANDFQKLLISTFGGMDKPKNPSEKGYAGLLNHLSNLTDSYRQGFRDQLLSTQIFDLKSEISMFDLFNDSGKRCAGMSGEVYNENQALFNHSLSMLE
ncbi:MAG: insulinase family protein [Lentisphaeria bacterium]|nr:insulinase family protein [Lentisphaeria bacterium]